MRNPFVYIGRGIADVAKAFAHAVATIFGLAGKIRYILKQQAPLDKPFIDGLTNLIADIEALLSEAQTAFTDAGLNFPADSAAYASFLKLTADAKALVPIVEDELAIIEGKALPVPLAEIPGAEPASQPVAPAAVRGTASTAV